MTDFRCCVVVPTYNNPDTVGWVVEALADKLPVVLVDDGSDARGRQAVAELGRRGLAEVVHRTSNGGKGAAVQTGFEQARRLGYSHALQVDADGQHELGDIDRFLTAAEATPEALILGAPIFDASAPLGRRIGRLITIFFTHLETAGPVIKDPMCGFRVYPLEAACRAAARCGLRMDFDIEIAVRMVWDQLPVVNLPTRVRYPEGGVSHFQLWRDNLRISLMHSRLCIGAMLRTLAWPVRGPLRAPIRSEGS